MLCREQKHNTLLLFQLVAKHGKVLLQKLIDTVKDKPVYYIDGDTPADQREKIRQDIGRQNEPASILAASYGTTQLGVNIPSLRTLILAHPSKSLIRVLQSIGRILRLDEGKTGATIIDVVDDLRIGRYENFAWKHAQARMAFYAAEKFPVTLKKVPLSMFAAHDSVASPAAQGATNDNQGGTQ